MGGHETMTKKYTWDVCEGDCLFYKDGAVIDYDDVVDLLNEQDQQIRELKEDNKQYKLIVESLKDENQKLKLRLKDLGVEYLSAGFERF